MFFSIRFSKHLQIYLQNLHQFLAFCLFDWHLVLRPQGRAELEGKLSPHPTPMDKSGPVFVLHACWDVYQLCLSLETCRSAPRYKPQ